MLVVLIGFDEKFHNSFKIENKVLADFIKGTKSNEDVRKLVLDQYEAKYMDTSLESVTDTILLIENDEVIRSI